MWTKEDKIISIHATPNELRGIANKIEGKLRDDITKSGLHTEKFAGTGDVTVQVVYNKP